MMNEKELERAAELAYLIGSALAPTFAERGCGIVIKCTEPLSEDQIARFKEEWSSASFSVSFEPMPLSDNFKAVILGESVDEYGREHFNGICPYTNKKCDTWTCGACKVEERERKFAEGDTE